MILLLGAEGYVGQAFACELRRQGRCFIPLSRRAFDYSRFELLLDYMRKMKPGFVINADGIWRAPNGNGYQDTRPEIFRANTLLPQTIGRACLMTNTPWGHVSSVCVFAGAKVFRDGDLRIETDLNEPAIRAWFAEHPENFVGFNETDQPNCSFRLPPCDYLVGTKALAEEWLQGGEQAYIWRVGYPFSESDDPDNFLSTLRCDEPPIDHFAPVSHLGDFVRACLELVELRAPFGVYNITNPGVLTTSQIAELIKRELGSGRQFHLGKGAEIDPEKPDSLYWSCIIDSTKLLQRGIKMRPARSALLDALQKWRPAEPSRETETEASSLRHNLARFFRLVEPS